jgi:hypothetical protein
LIGRLLTLYLLSPSANNCILNAIIIMQDSAETDPQGKRLLFILQAFRDVVVEQRAKAAQAANDNGVYTCCEIL